VTDMHFDSEILIARVVDGEATAEQWTLFCRMAEVDPSLWRELAEAQHQQSELSAQVNLAVAAADHVEAPVAQEMALRFNQRVRAAVVVGGWSGWLAAAAALLIAWGMGVPGLGGSGLGGLGGGSGGLSPDGIAVKAGLGGGIGDALKTYLDRGRETGQVVGELPERVLIEARPLNPEESGGKYEVFYLRQIMERVVVDEFFGVGSDDMGRPTPVRLDPFPAANPQPM
jgi:hypothetical protein